MTKPHNPLVRMAGAVSAALVALLALLGCDAQRISELQVGVATEADVRQRFGEPDGIWPEAGGGQTLEYTRQPAGHSNYMITLGADGKLLALQQVLEPAQFARVQPGLDKQAVRRLLGKPAKQTMFSLKQETDWDWNWIEPPNREKIFTVTFGRDGLVLRTASLDKPQNGP